MQLGEKCAFQALCFRWDIVLLFPLLWGSLVSGTDTQELLMVFTRKKSHPIFFFVLKIYTQYFSVRSSLTLCLISFKYNDHKTSAILKGNQTFSATIPNDFYRYNDPKTSAFLSKDLTSFAIITFDIFFALKIRYVNISVRWFLNARIEFFMDTMTPQRQHFQSKSKSFNGSH